MANNTGVIPKTYLERSNPSLFFANQPSQPTIPQLPTFFRDVPSPKGEVPFMVWQYEVQCLFSLPDLSPLHVLHFIRSSLRGSARLMIVPLGNKASIDDVLASLMPCNRMLHYKRNSSQNLSIAV